MPFWELRVATSPDTSEALTNFLWEQGALGVVEEEAPGRPPHLRAFYPESASPESLLATVRIYQASLAALGFPLGSAETEIGPVLDAEWASAWQQSFPPRPVGRRLLVLPPWETVPSSERGPESGPERVVVIIEPGRAFGTGHHGSTEGCLTLLDELSQAWREGVAPPARLLDVGSGTGILAIAAIKLGAPRVTCIDIDPDALVATRRNAELNGCSDRIECGLAGPEAIEPGVAFDLVLANLLTHTHLALAPEYRRLVAPGGALVLGGMLAGEDKRVADALRGDGFAPGARIELEGWASLLLKRAHG